MTNYDTNYFLHAYTSPISLHISLPFICHRCHIGRRALHRLMEQLLTPDSPARSALVETSREGSRAAVALVSIYSAYLVGSMDAQYSRAFQLLFSVDQLFRDAEEYRQQLEEEEDLRQEWGGAAGSDVDMDMDADDTEEPNYSDTSPHSSPTPRMLDGGRLNEDRASAAGGATGSARRVSSTIEQEWHTYSKRRKEGASSGQNGDELY